MSVTVSFSVPQDCNDYCAVRLYESDEELGTYLFVHEETISEGQTGFVYDDGDPSKWYRLSFVACGTDGQETGVSTPFQGSAIPVGPYDNRIAGRPCHVIKLDTYFYHNGRLTDPYAIRSIKIYKRSVSEENLKLEIPVPAPDATDYPFPIVKDDVNPGTYYLYLEIPEDFDAPDIYFDVWCFIPGSECLDVTGLDFDDESNWECQCNKFWVYPDGWFVTDKLITPRLAFEPLDVKFRAGESRYLEVGLTPLPLYDYDYNLITPMIPYLRPTITVQTRNKEVIIDGEEMEMGLRQGAYRTNPFVAKWMVDTSRFIRGTYDYRITITLPDGQTMVSPDFTITIS